MVMIYSSDEPGAPFKELVVKLKARGINHHVAEDAAMDALCKEIEGEQNSVDLGAWIFRIALNTAFTNGRKMKVANNHRKALAYHAARLRENEVSEPWEKAARREETGILAKLMSEALLTLSVLDREIVVQKIVFDATIEELAYWFDTTEGAVRGRLQRGRKKLRRYLTRHNADLGEVV
jgi:RNA polymerase sigma-70 factor (ECF subfamily)